MPAKAGTMADKKIELGPGDWVPDDFMHNNWIAIEYVREVLADVRERLTAGAEGAGATLNADECAKVLGCMQYTPDPRGRPPVDWMAKQAANAPIARYCLDLEKGEPLKSAVAKTAERFGCSTSKVRSARPDEAKTNSAAMSAWIDSNRGKTRRKSNRRTASKPAESITSQSTAPSKRSQKRKAGADPTTLAPAPTNSVTGTPLRIPYGNKDVALKLGARYGSTGWFAPPGVDLSLFEERGWL
jgi:hypothetical protein